MYLKQPARYLQQRQDVYELGELIRASVLYAESRQQAVMVRKAGREVAVFTVPEMKKVDVALTIRLEQYTAKNIDNGEVVSVTPEGEVQIEGKKRTYRLNFYSQDDQMLKLVVTPSGNVRIKE